MDKYTHIWFLLGYIRFFKIVKATTRLRKLKFAFRRSSGFYTEALHLIFFKYVFTELLV